jgi:hypothetical protein
VEGIKVAGDRAVFIPTAHDEPPLRFAVFRAAFEGVRSYAFCSAPEARLVASRFDISKCSQDVVGIGVEPPDAPDVEEFRIVRGIERPYLLYAGRSTRARVATRCCGSTSGPRETSWVVPTSI